MQDNTRDLAVQALTEIKAHTASCERRYVETIDILRDMTSKMDGLKTDMSEVMGGYKVAKVVAGAIGAIGGVIGGLGSHIVLK